MRWYFLDDNNWNKLKTELLSWLGTPYMHMCGVKHRGVDCNQFIGASATIAGILNGYYYKIYAPDWYLHIDKEMILDYLEQHREKMKDGLDLIQLPKDVELMRGDVLCFAIYSKVVNHSAVMLDDNTFINSAVGRGVCIYEFNDYWKRHLKAVYRVMEE